MSLALLWHMHQPDYRDRSGEFIMPWVFLHAIRDYYDMPLLLSCYKLKASFNLTPTLIEQIDAYIENGPQCDRFLRLCSKDPSSLSINERRFVVRLCKSANFETMVSPLPRFRALYKQKEFSDEELTDLECCFLLSWCGSWLRENDETVKTLLYKERFSKHDKEALLKALFELLPKIIPLYNSLQKSGQISLTTTPYSHPILPLLLDINIAKEADPSISLPTNSLSLVDDAKRHIQRAKEIYYKHFGVNPLGVWPAEGAIDSKSAMLFKKAGLRWIATDEAILKKSGAYDPYRVYDYMGLKLLFRDHELSDLIGFSYRNLPAMQAAQDFRGRLEEKRGVVVVILDGENAWEYYPNGGRKFLEAFYTMLEGFNTLTFDEAATLPAKRLEHLAPGSWIDRSFRTWIGDKEKNRAWELLFQTRIDAHRLGKESDLEIVSHFLSAEASDWFWWYGEGHYTEFALEFDRLFREHLVAIYQLMEIDAPKVLFRSILSAQTADSIVKQPYAPIQPVIDGKISSFFEWIGAGVIDERQSQGSMQSVSNMVERIFWGSDEEFIYFRLDAKEAKSLQFKLFFDEFEPKLHKKAANEIIEIAVSKSDLTKRVFEVRFELYNDSKLVGVFPSSVSLFIDTEENYAKNWFV